MPTAKPLRYRYRFAFPDGNEKAFEVGLDPASLRVIPPNPGAPPAEWARLDFSKCGHCPLPPEATHCPIATQLSGVLHEFKDVLSFERAQVVVETPERTISKEVPVQQGLSTLLGIYMVASGCPVFDKLRPLVRFHLPFASPEETVYRVVTMYVTTQFLRMKKGLEADWSLEKLRELYGRIQDVNAGFCGRLHRVINEDAMPNAVVILNCFANFLTMPSQTTLDRVWALFELDEPKA